MAGAGERTDGEEPVLTVLQAASELGVSRETIDSWIRRGYLPAVSTAGARGVRRDDLRRLGAVRQVARANRLRVTTLRHWADEAR
jgi:excisionase family DNA binding protein